jgi:2,3-bisphosphoglycerate-dependent phosphoglycerate mutase
MSTLVLVRHGQSTYNLENLFTGWVDVDLTDKGIKEAQAAARVIQEKKFRPSLCYTSDLIRAQKTLDIILEINSLQHLPIVKNQALNERHYGELQGKNKTETAKEFGEEQVKIWRRSYDIAPPGGESLKMTAERTLPYFDSEILPQLHSGKDILIVAHGNSLRSIVMEIEKLSPEQILKTEIGTGEARFYSFDGKSFQKTQL